MCHARGRTPGEGRGRPGALGSSSGRSIPGVPSRARRENRREGTSSAAPSARLTIPRGMEPAAAAVSGPEKEKGKAYCENAAKEPGAVKSPSGLVFISLAAGKGARPTQKTQLHLDRCLTCRSCETTCPSGVQYGRLADIGRGIVEEKVGRSAWDRARRALLGAVLPRTGLFSLLLSIGRAFRPLLPGKLKEKIPGEVAEAGPWPKPRPSTCTRRLAATGATARASASPPENSPPNRTAGSGRRSGTRPVQITPRSARCSGCSTRRRSAWP